MGYPMTYKRVVGRNRLCGDYTEARDVSGGNAEAFSAVNPKMIAGDLRRLETDSRDPVHLRHYSAVAGITPEQAKAVLDEFFGASDYHTFPGW